MYFFKTIYYSCNFSYPQLEALGQPSHLPCFLPFASLFKSLNSGKNQAQPTPHCKDLSQRHCKGYHRTKNSNLPDVHHICSLDLKDIPMGGSRPTPLLYACTCHSIKLDATITTATEAPMMPKENWCQEGSGISIMRIVFLMNPSGNIIR